jgi:hypothetical protein
MGVDLGQSTDPTAICVMNHRVIPGTEWKLNNKNQTCRQERTEHFDVRHLERLPLGMSYPEQVQRVVMMLERPPLNSGCKLVIDETGVGRAVGDIFDAAGVRPNRITITAGQEATQQSGVRWHVAKGNLISGVDARLHTGELRIAEALSDAGVLQEELLDFQTRSQTRAGRLTTPGPERTTTWSWP